MAWFKKAPRAPPPIGWSEPLWNEAFRLRNDIHGIVLVRAIEKRLRWMEDHEAPVAETTYYGGWGCASGSAVAYVQVQLFFETGPSHLGGPSVPPSARGYVSTSAWDEAYGGAPILYVVVRASEEHAEEFEAAYHRALWAGLDFVPFWVTGSARADPIRNENGFNVVQPLTSFSYQQRLSLNRKLPQDA